ncbi:hypothetical protein BU24DRAFT_338566 [Aaosphaeria arxii CBS 175.79]|uniref:Formin GTPase-binding domain-containing protein n=1 Tax=Aaosphaeria arxii CBS 175.79 TaxID=1450172 RepID=A0A6A5Y4V0_9PLEO|nr:uncharacterized protein BU24DRAFT_338566 [Aaosphaeria arxii CBS 175.79]KAF2020538.1 hypothetical protein BU24DRAFT_338566 [Aaosphaeria arxii CBS 175.79]
MASIPATRPTEGQHRRNKSSSVLKSIIAPKSHKRSPSDGSALSQAQPEGRLYNPIANAGASFLPPDHPHNQLRSQVQNIPIQPPSSPKKSQDTKTGSPTKSLHKKTLSSVSLRSLGKDKERDARAKDRSRDNNHSRDKSRAREDTTATDKPKKTKSTTNLAAVFGKAKHSSTKEPVALPKDKENTTPPSSARATEPAITPIWAQFSSQPFEEVTTTSKVPLNDRRSIEDEMRLYTPSNYSPSKQRNFFDYGQPSLQKPAGKERPKSTFLPNTSSNGLFETLTKKRSTERAPLGETKGNGEKSTSSKSISAKSMLRRSNSDSKKKDGASKRDASPGKKPNRVMAAVAAFNGKAKEVYIGPTPPPKLDPKQIDAEFEAVLESRNIPQHQRTAMRTLKLEVKADFVRTHKLDTPQTMSRATSAQGSMTDVSGNSNTKWTSEKAPKSRDGSDEEVQGDGKTGASTKRERPRSRTFTFSKGDSPTKKAKPERPGNERKTSSKATPIPKSPSTRSLVSNTSQKSSSKSAKSSSPDEFVTYMKKTTKPQDVEVGKLHKLRLLLRNETVEWVDLFLHEGGMTELVGLLYRIMEVEWREDHEDQLLHEVLRCLKGLCTADSALKQFAEISPKLYPALLGMLFDEEHKGPCEFTTRELIIQIIFAHISSAHESELSCRARELLTYLKDPVKEKESSTVPFILQMHQPRPYQVWCKEITNVTKEVFWIFIHHLNVVPLPRQESEDTAPASFAKTHFPGPRAIVPAAPYVGGVEWDATNYIATHIDLLNGIIASLPTREARNTFRQECKVSGFEKLMGHLRACNPKFYGAVHDAVKVWIKAGLEDDWDVKTVRMGAGDGKGPSSPVKASPTKKSQPPPQIQAPKMDLGMGLGFDKEIGAVGKKDDDDWF